MDIEESELEQIRQTIEKFRLSDPPEASEKATTANTANLNNIQEIPPEKPAKLWDVAQHLISLENERLQKKQSGYSLDRWKLQKLCYYAQGLYLAQFSSPLFEDDLIAYDYGPYNHTLNTTCNGLYNKYDLDQEKLKNWKFKYTLSPNQSEHLNMIFHANVNKSGQMLMEQSHGEDPWRHTKTTEIITKEKLKIYFQRQKLTSSITKMLDQAKKVITKKQFKDIIALYDTLAPIRQASEFFVKENQLCDKTACDVWPSQNPLDIPNQSESVGLKRWKESLIRSVEARAI